MKTPCKCSSKHFVSPLWAPNLLQVYFGTMFAKLYLNADMLGINGTTGMSCLLRKDVVDEAGGLVPFGAYLCEDFYLAQAFIDR